MKLTIDNPAIDFGDTAFLSIVAQVPDFILADSLNRLFNLNLRRIDDLQPFGYPHYVDNSHAPLEYRLLHLVGDDNSFLLIVDGNERAHQAVTNICDVFNAPDQQPNHYDLPAIEQQEILSRFRQGFTMVNDIRFSDEDLELASSPGRRKLKGRAALADQYARILDAIDLASIKH